MIQIKGVTLTFLQSTDTKLIHINIHSKVYENRSF